MPIDKNKWRILIVDDNAKVRQVLSDLLEKRLKAEVLVAKAMRRPGTSMHSRDFELRSGRQTGDVTVSTATTTQQRLKTQ